MQSPTAPIVRVFRVSTTPDVLRSVEPLLTAHVDRFAPQWRSVFAHWVGVAHGASAVELVTVTGWESATALSRARDGDGGRAVRTGPLGDLVGRGSVEDFELLDQLVSCSEPAMASVMRLVRLPVRREREAELLDLVQPAREDWAGSGELAVTQVLRRDDADGPTLLVVAAWRDAASLMRRRGGPDAAVTPRDLLRAPAAEETYDLLPVSALHLRPTGPAILIADDAGAVVDATPAAAALLGRDIWDLLGLRIGEIVPAGEASGAVRIGRPEGGVVLVHARSAPDVPAPGRHATLLVSAAAGPPSEDDLREAIRLGYRGWSGRSDPALAGGQPAVVVPSQTPSLEAPAAADR